MGKVKGIVLRGKGKYVYVLTGEGEYIKAFAGQQEYLPGSEIEIARPRTGRHIWVLALAASFMILLAFPMWQIYSARTLAYLALDINPGILLMLDGQTTVTGAEALNAEGEGLLKNLDLRGEKATRAVELLLDEAYRQNYLQPEIDNAVYLTLAAPPGYGATETEIRAAAAGKIKNLQLDSYLRVSGTGVDAAVAARERKESLNAVTLRQELVRKGVLKDGVKGLNAAEPAAEPAAGPVVAPAAGPVAVPSTGPSAGPAAVPSTRSATGPVTRPVTGPPVSVRDIVSEVGVKKVFNENEFIPGRAKDKRSVPPGLAERLPRALQEAPGQQRHQASEKRDK